MNKVYPLMAVCLVGLGLQGCQRQRTDDCCEPRDVVVQEKYVHKYGVNVPQKDWVERGMNGQVVTTMKSGVTVTKNFQEGVPEGEVTYTYPHSEVIEKVENYRHGEKVKVVEYFLSGAPRKEILHHTPTTTEINTWYEHGTPQVREIYNENELAQGDYYTTNNLVEARVHGGSGTRINRDEFGQMISSDRIKNGQLTQRTTFYPNGATKEIIPYVKGEVTGVKKTYLPAGEPQSVEEWENNQPNGLTTLYQNGEKVGEVPYVHGKKHGLESRYRDGEYVVEEVHWEAGVRHGPVNSYIGEKVHKSWYIHGKEVSKSQYERFVRPTVR